MEKVFIQTKYQGNLDLPRDLINQLPTKIMVATTIQFIKYLPEIKSKLSAYGKEVFFFQSAHSRALGQILGCDQFKVRPGLDCFLYLGDGLFHPKALLINQLPVFCYNPLTNQWNKLSRKEIEENRLRKKVALTKFHSAKKIGILVSVKEKQNQLQGPAKQLKEKLEQQGKEVYLFLTDEIKDLENFNFIEGWVNTACPRISDDFPGMINIREIEP